MKAHKWRAVKIYILSQQSVFSFYFLLPHLKICPSWHFPKMKIPPFPLTASDFPFAHKPQNSHSESAIQSREAWCASLWRAAEMQWNEASWGCCLISPHSPCQRLTLLIDFCTAELCSHIIFSLWPLLTKGLLVLDVQGCGTPGKPTEQLVLPEHRESCNKFSPANSAETLTGTTRWNTTSWGVWMLRKKGALTCCPSCFRAGEVVLGKACLSHQQITLTSKFNSQLLEPRQNHGLPGIAISAKKQVKHHKKV